MNEDNNKYYKDRSVWMRGMFMLLFVFLMGVAKFVMLVTVVLQFLIILFSAGKNEHLLRFGKSISVYQYQIMLFLTFNSEERPYPMTDWPE